MLRPAIEDRLLDVDVLDLRIVRRASVRQCHSPRVSDTDGRALFHGDDGGMEQEVLHLLRSEDRLRDGGPDLGGTRYHAPGDGKKSEHGCPMRDFHDGVIRSSLIRFPPRICSFCALVRKVALRTKSTPTGQSKG